MLVKVNGESITTRATNLAELLKELNLKEEVVVIEKNAQILDRGNYASVAVEEDDDLEIIRFMGGG